MKKILLVSLLILAAGCHSSSNSLTAASDKIIDGVDTDVAAFVGYTPKGPAQTATQVTSYSQFTSLFGDVGDLGNDNQVGFSVREFFLNGGVTAWIVRVPPSGSERLPIAADILGDSKSRTGLYALDALEHFSQLVIPDLIRFTSADAQPLIDGALQYAHDRRAFFIVDPPSDLSTPDLLVTWIQNQTAGDNLRNGALYFPLINVATPSGHSRTIGPGGAVAGLCASVDISDGVWTAPAGLDKGRLLDVLAPSTLLTNAENGLLTSNGINPIIQVISRGTVVWGARTLNGSDALQDPYMFLNVRRLSLYIESSLLRGLGWTAFEANNTALWNNIVTEATAFMQKLQNQGAFYSFTVACDASTTTPTDIANGVVNAVLSFSPIQPAEFVVVTLQLQAQIP